MVKTSRGTNIFQSYRRKVQKTQLSNKVTEFVMKRITLSSKNK